MNNLMRNKRPFYICKQIEKDGRIIYDKPVKVRANFQPIADKDMGEILAFGQDYVNRFIVYFRPSQAKYFNNNDRCYVFVDPPAEHDITCNTADFYIDGHPTRYINESTVHLQRMRDDVNG